MTTPISSKAVSAGTKEIPLSQGMFAIVDSLDYSWLNQWKWSAYKDRSCWYAHRQENGKKVRMHRLLLGLKKGELCDHVNGDGLDNRRSNIRKCSISQNNFNRRYTNNRTSKYQGVSKSSGRFYARIGYKKRVYFLGSFTKEEDAGMVYKVASQILFESFSPHNHHE